MIADELKIMFDELRADIASLKLEIILVSHDVTVIREQVENLKLSQPRESIGIAPNTPPPDFLPREKM
jgi:hypothetical protein